MTSLLALSILAAGSPSHYRALTVGNVIQTDSNVTVTEETYHGWPGSLRISNGAVDLVVVPQIGRVMRYGYIGSENVLWENAAVAAVPGSQSTTWTNYGGDKLWPAPQSNWNWPPDPALDPGSYTATRIPGGVRLTCKSSPKTKIVLSRDIILAEAGTVVTFQNRLQNVGPARMICPWQVTQVDNPKFVILEMRQTSAQPKGYYAYGVDTLTPGMQDLDRDGLILHRDPVTSRKFGSTGETGELKAVKTGLVFHDVQARTRGAVYPDNNSAQQVYLSNDPLAYVELEQVAPLTTLETNQVQLQTVRWSLTDKL